MEKRFYFIQLFLLAGLIGFYWGCNKTDHPFGVNAPLGLDVPTSTPTPIKGSFQVLVQDKLVPIQGVNVFAVDPYGNTKATSATSAIYGIATLSPPSLINGVWNIFLPSQGVSYIVSGPQTIQHYYFNTSIPVTVSGSGSYSVTFISSGVSVYLGSVSQTFSPVYPENLAVTASYNPTGNLNIPVSTIISTSIVGTGAYPQNFVFGEGVTQQPVTITKNLCFKDPLPVSLIANDFVGFNISNVSVTISRGYPVSFNWVGECLSNQSSCTSCNITFEIFSLNACAVSFGGSVDSTHGFGNIWTGSYLPGVPVTFTDTHGYNDNLNFAFTDPTYGQQNANANIFSMPSSAGITFGTTNY